MDEAITNLNISIQSAVKKSTPTSKPIFPFLLNIPSHKRSLTNEKRRTKTQ